MDVEVVEVVEVEMGEGETTNVVVVEVDAVEVRVMHSILCLLSSTTHFRKTNEFSLIFTHD